MAVFKFNNKMIVFITFVSLQFFKGVTEKVVIENTWLMPTNLEHQELCNGESEEEWLENALIDIAYYLRNHKFNEWDRRFYKKHTSPRLGFYDAFPTPSLNSIHWEVQKNCHKDFFTCVTYLHSVIVTAPFTRIDDITTTLNKNMTGINTTLLRNRNNDCKKALSYMETTGLPFGGTDEKFNWRTSASYYMCWYTTNGIPTLSMLGEVCDNFASCLDEAYGHRNHDPRADDKLAFACAMYSFCPDPCCPLKHLKKISDCYNSVNNPCFVENVNNCNILHRRCSFDRKENQDLEQIIENKWNISCYCQQKGFTWDSQFGMCVDTNECATKEHKCDANSEDCLNLPGTFKCVCKWGYTYNGKQKKCVRKNILVISKETDKPLNFKNNFDWLMNYII